MKKYNFIYKTTNLINGKIYIGKHCTNKDNLNPKYLGSGKRLKLAVKKYGYENFTREIIAFAHSDKILNLVEIQYIKYYQESEFTLYNIAKGGEGNMMEYASNYHKKLLENCQKMWEVNKNRGPVSEETRKKISKAMKNKIRGPKSEETRKKISDALKSKGKSHSEETRRKISEAAKKRPSRGPISEETRKKISEAAKKRGPISEETRKKLSKAGKNRKPISEETRRKISDAAKKQHRSRHILEEI